MRPNQLSLQRLKRNSPVLQYTGGARLQMVDMDSQYLWKSPQSHNRPSPHCHSYQELGRQPPQDQTNATAPIFEHLSRCGGLPVIQRGSRGLGAPLEQHTPRSRRFCVSRCRNWKGLAEQGGRLSHYAILTGVCQRK